MNARAAGPDPTWQNALGDYEEWLWGNGLSQRSIDLRTQFAGMRLEEWPRLDVAPHQVARWLARYDGWTRNTYLGHLRSLFAWAVETGRVESDPTVNIKRSPQPAPNPQPLTSSEVERLLEAATGDTRLWLLLALLAGLRRHEIAKLRGEDFDERQFRFVGKGGKIARIPMHPALWAELQERPRAGLLFPNPKDPARAITPNVITQRIFKLFRELGVDGGIHRARATYATDLLRSGANIRVVQALMRHSSLAATEHYLAATEEELTDAVRGLDVVRTAGSERDARGAA